MNTGNILLGDSTLRNPNPTPNGDDYVRSDHRIRLIGENTNKSFSKRNTNMEYYADLWDDGVFTTTSGRVGLWCLNGYGPACEWEVCRTPFIELYDEIAGIAHPQGADIPEYTGYYNVTNSTVEETGYTEGEYSGGSYLSAYECRCDFEVVYNMAGSNINQTDTHHVGSPHDLYAGVIYASGDIALYYDVLDYNCQNMCEQKANSFNSLTFLDNVLYPNACFAELPALLYDPEDCIDIETIDGTAYPSLKTGLGECQDVNFMVGFVRDMSEFDEFGYLPTVQGGGVPHIWSEELVGKDTQGSTKGIFMGIGKVDSTSGSRELAYWWTSPMNDEEQVTDSSDYSFEKIPDSIFDFEFSAIDSGMSITKKSGRFVTEGGATGDWFIDISKCAHTTDWDLSNWDPLKAMIQSNALGIDDPMLGHNWEVYGSREQYEQACLNPNSSGLGSAMEFSAETPSAGKIAFIYDSGSYSLNGIVADYDILDATRPSGAGSSGTLMGFNEDGESSMHGFWLGLYGALEGMYPESWWWAAFGVPLSNTVIPYEHNYQIDKYGISEDELYPGQQQACGCHLQSRNLPFYWETSGGTCIYEDIETGEIETKQVGEYLTELFYMGGGYPMEGNIMTPYIHCFSTDFFRDYVNSYNGNTGLVVGEGEGEAELAYTSSGFAFPADNGGNGILRLGRPEVPVQVQNEAFQTMNDDNSLKFSDFPNIREYAMRLIGNFASSDEVSQGTGIMAVPWLAQAKNENGNFVSRELAGKNGAIWKGQLKQILSGQAFCDYYDINSDEGKRCGFRRWNGSYGKSSIGMGDGASSWADRIGGPPITEPFTYSKVMDYLFYISNQGEYTSLFRLQNDGSVISPVKNYDGGITNHPGNAIEGAPPNINKNYKYYPGCPGPDTFGSDDFIDLFSKGYYDLLEEEFGTSLDYLGIHGIRSADNYYLTDKDAIGASNGINTFLDGDKGHWCGPTLAASNGSDGSWFPQSLVEGEADVGNNQIGTFYYHHAGPGGFQSGMNCVDWAYTSLIMSYPSINYYGHGDGLIYSATGNRPQDDLSEELSPYSNITDWNGGRATARIAEIKSPVPEDFWGGNHDIEGAAAGAANDYDPYRVQPLISCNAREWFWGNPYTESACPTWGCTSPLYGSDWYRSDSWCGGYYGGTWGNSHARSRCYCTNSVTGDEVYNSDAGDCSVSWTDDDDAAAEYCDNYCSSLNSYTVCDTGKCEAQFEQLYNYCMLRNTTFSSPIPDKCHGMVRPGPRPWNPYLNLNDMKMAYLAQPDTEFSGDAVAIGWRNLTQSTWDIVPLPFGWWGGYKQGFQYRDGEVDGLHATDYYAANNGTVGDVTGDSFHLYQYHPFGDANHGIAHVSAHPTSVTMRYDNYSTGWNDLEDWYSNPEHSFPLVGYNQNPSDTYADFAGESWRPIGIGNDMYVPYYNSNHDYGDFSGGVPHSCMDFCSDHYCKSCGYPKGWGTIYLDGSSMGAHNDDWVLGDDLDLSQYWSHGGVNITGNGFLQTDTRLSGDMWHGMNTRTYGSFSLNRGVAFELGYWNDTDGRGSETLGDHPFCLCKCDKADDISTIPTYAHTQLGDLDSHGESSGGGVDVYFSNHDWSNSTFWKQFETQEIPGCKFTNLSNVEQNALLNTDTFHGGAWVKNYLETEDEKVWRPWYMLSEGSDQCQPLLQLSGPGQNRDNISNCLKGGGIPYTGCLEGGPEDRISGKNGNGLEFRFNGTWQNGGSQTTRAFVELPDMPEPVDSEGVPCPSGQAGWCCGANYRYLSAKHFDDMDNDAWEDIQYMLEESLDWRYVGHEIFVAYDDDYWFNTGLDQTYVDILPTSHGPGNLWHQVDDDDIPNHTYAQYSYYAPDGYGHMADSGKPYSLRSNNKFSMGQDGPFDWPKVRKPYQDLIESCEDMGGEVTGIPTPLQKSTLAWNSSLSDIGTSTMGCGGFCETDMYITEEPVQKWDAKKTIYKHSKFLQLFRSSTLLSDLVHSNALEYSSYQDILSNTFSCNDDDSWVQQTAWCVQGVSSPCEMFNDPMKTNFEDDNTWTNTYTSTTHNDTIYQMHLDWFTNHYMNLYNEQLSWTNAFYAGLIYNVLDEEQNSFGSVENQYGSSWNIELDDISNLESFFTNSAEAPFFLHGNWRECGFPTHIQVPSFSFPSVQESQQAMAEELLHCDDCPGYVDSYGTDCWWYNQGSSVDGTPGNAAYCGQYEIPGSTFTANDACCICGGGTTGPGGCQTTSFAEGGSVQGRGSGTRDADCCTIGPGTMNFNCSGNVINSVDYNCNPGATIPAGVTVGSTCPGSADGAGSVSCDCFGCGDPIDDDINPTDPGGSCCDEGPGTYGPAICDGNTIIGISRGNCSSDASVPFSALFDNVGQYCHDPHQVTGPCECNEDCQLYYQCGDEFSQFQTYISQECWDWSQEEPPEPCPEGYTQTGGGDCIMEDPPPPCECCPEEFGSGTYTCERDDTGNIILIDNCNYEHGAMLPVPPIFANLGVCGLDIGQHDDNPLNESGLEVNGFEEDGSKGQGASIGTWRCGCDCIFVDHDINTHTNEILWPYENNPFELNCNPVGLWEYFKCAMNISWLGQAKKYVAQGLEHLLPSEMEDYWEIWNNTSVDDIHDLQDEYIATMNCQEPQGYAGLEPPFDSCGTFYANNCEIFGCMNELADNYNSQATDEGPYPCWCSDGTDYEDNITHGCLNPAAGNYDSSARCDCAGNNCMQGSACSDEGYRGLCRDYPWLCDTSCCIAVQDTTVCGSECQEFYETSLTNGYQNVAHRIISWSNIKNDVVDNSSVNFNNNVNQCFTSAAGRLYGSNRIFGSYADMIAAGYNEYGCPPNHNCQWSSGDRNGMPVMGMLCVPDNNGGGGFNTGGSGGDGVIDGLRNESEFGRLSKDDLTHDPYIDT